MEEDKIKGMSYKMKDPKTGEEKVYEVSYSQVLQKRIDEHLIEVKKEIRTSNKLKLIILITGLILIIFTALIFFRTGIVGLYLRRMVCL